MTRVNSIAPNGTTETNGALYRAIVANLKTTVTIRRSPPSPSSSSSPPYSLLGDKSGVPYSESEYGGTFSPSLSNGDN